MSIIYVYIVKHHKTQFSHRCPPSDMQTEKRPKRCCGTAQADNDQHANAGRPEAQLSCANVLRGAGRLSGPTALAESVELCAQIGNEDQC